MAFVIPTDNGTFLWLDEPTELPTITFNLRHLSHLTEKIPFFSNAVIFFFVFFRKKRRKQKQNNFEEKERNFLKKDINGERYERVKPVIFFVLFYCVFCYRLFVLPDTFCESQDERIKKQWDREKEREMTSRKEQVFICHMIRT